MSSYMSLELNYQEFKGRGSVPCIVLHGLLGSSRNWTSTGKLLADRFHVYALDLRNHGGSPHSETMNYPSMAGDVLKFMEQHGLSDGVLIGHSMGGKVAMRVACDHPEKILGLGIVDIANREYPPRWEKEFSAMRALPVDRISTRREAEEGLAETISDWAFRKFLCTNLERNESGEGFHWIVNLDVLQASLPKLFVRMPEEHEQYSGPTVFIRGEKSRFVEDEDIPAMNAHFPKAKMVTVQDAGHNVHFDNPEGFLAALEPIFPSKV